MQKPRLAVHAPRRTKSLTGYVHWVYKSRMMHLSDYMEWKGLNDLEVAEGINRTRSTVSRIRRRLVRPDWETIEKIKTFSGGLCTADDFQVLEAAE